MAKGRDNTISVAWSRINLMGKSNSIKVSVPGRLVGVVVLDFIVLFSRTDKDGSYVTMCLNMKMPTGHLFSLLLYSVSLLLACGTLVLRRCSCIHLLTRKMQCDLKCSWVELQGVEGHTRGNGIHDILWAGGRYGVTRTERTEIEFVVTAEAETTG